MKLTKFILLAILAVTFASCEDMFEPALENNRTIDDMYNDPNYAQGLLGYGYNQLPYSNSSVSDIATDDAVTNDLSSGYVEMALGSWSASQDPMSQWQARKAAIQYLNTFLEIVDQVNWSDNKAMQQMFVDKYTGEALGLRALQYYYLLRAHGGYNAGGQLLGVPLLLEPESATSDFNQPRAPFAECVAQMFTDLDQAIALLPLDFEDVKSNASVPAKYREIGATDGTYNLVFGTYQRGRLTGRIAEAIKAQVALFAASPAFADASGVTMQQAAEYAAVVLNRIGGVSGMDPKGNTWYMNTAVIDVAEGGDSPAEIIWRGNRTNGTDDWDMGITQERNNFPPSLYGSGRINPSQNLVDAFPMANGTPITEAGSGYNANDPYAGRDPRLAAYVIYNGATFKDKAIITGNYADASGSQSDNIGQLNTSTRTGYYLRKLLREDCNPDPNATNAKYHWPVRIRYTEIFLAYAEAANEAYGPDGKAAGASYSAYDVIAAIRERAGIEGDSYLTSIKSDKAKMTELIRNERRLELCFENHRFYDLRRWNLPLNEPARGVRISQGAGGALNYEPFTVEERRFQDYMTYGPIPQSEVIKWSNLEQNKGW